MKYLTPAESASLASNIYDVKSKKADGKYAFSNPLPNKFRFNTSEEGLLKGVTGAKLLPFFKTTTGFGSFGLGINERKGEAIIVLRGTDKAHDFVTDLQSGVRTGSSGSVVHSGFNNTFQSMLPKIKEHLVGMPPLRIHCVGHSLGGALATLLADWIVNCSHHKAILYTFGCPRVGLDAFARKVSLNPKIEKIFRVTHKGDVVTMVPLWPFTHAPINGDEYRVDSASVLGPSAHFMSALKGGNPGYVESVSGHQWETLARRADSVLTFQSSSFLKYSDRHETTFSRSGLEKITTGLLSLLKATGHYASIYGQAKMGSLITFYDVLAQTVEKIARSSRDEEEKVRGLLGHILSFIGEGKVILKEITYQVIKTIFNKLMNRLNQTAGYAMSNGY